MSLKPQPSALFGDLELAVDLLLNGDPKIKRQIAVADQKDRGGYQALLNALRRMGVKATTSAHERLLQSLAGDQEYYHHKLNDLRNIRQRGDNYTARVHVEHNRYSKTFTSLSEAQDWRFQMEVLHAQTVASL